MAKAAVAAKDDRALLAERRKVATELLNLQSEIGPLVLAIDAAKDRLREICGVLGDSFTEEVPGLGAVEVKAGKAKEFKGTLAKLQLPVWLGLTPKKRESLIADGIVVEEQQWSPARSASVTVRL